MGNNQSDVADMGAIDPNNPHAFKGYNVANQNIHHRQKQNGTPNSNSNANAANNINAHVQAIRQTSAPSNTQPYTSQQQQSTSSQHKQSQQHNTHTPSSQQQQQHGSSHDPAASNVHPQHDDSMNVDSPTATHESHADTQSQRHGHSHGHAHGGAAHSPHLTMQGTDVHDVSMHDLTNADASSQHQESSMDMPPPLLLDNSERMDSGAGAGDASAGVAANNYFHKPVETVPTAFKWTHVNGSSPEEVYLTGSFNNWQGKILMYKQEEGEFALIIDIPPGIHHYKYIVDGEWRLDEDAPTVVHSGVENNIVEVKRPVFEYTPASYADSDDEDGTADSSKRTAPYSQRAPLSSDYVQEPTRCPPHLSQSQVALNHTSSQDPTWLPIPSSVMINHLYVLDATQHNLLVTGITQRFKPNKQTRITHKFVTTVYYCPKPSKPTDMYFPSRHESHTQSQQNQLSLNIGHVSPNTGNTPAFNSIQLQQQDDNRDKNEKQNNAAQYNQNQSLYQIP